MVAPVSRPNDDLRRMPPPAEKITVAVYDLDDLTGQFKERENVQSLSQAVTQGGAAMLIKALQDAGERRWFTVLDRKRARQPPEGTPDHHRDAPPLPRRDRTSTRTSCRRCMHAGIIIEGGIIGYDTNIMTGGAGARFLGIGGDTKYIQDVVTVTLRAVSTKTGEVLTR